MKVRGREKMTIRKLMLGTVAALVLATGPALAAADEIPVPVGNSILLATDIESGDAPALCERSVA
jgi:hypothetical protein